jgi:hypothetical protein
MLINPLKLIKYNLFHCVSSRSSQAEAEDNYADKEIGGHWYDELHLITLPVLRMERFQDLSRRSCTKSVAIVNIFKVIGGATRVC